MNIKYGVTTSRAGAIVLETEVESGERYLLRDGEYTLDEVLESPQEFPILQRIGSDLYQVLTNFTFHDFFIAVQPLDERVRDTVYNHHPTYVTIVP